MYERGVDLTKKPHTKIESSGQDFEEACFAELLEQSTKGQFSIGPNLIDGIFSTGHHGTLIRPDAIMFDASDEDVWILAGIHEFRLKKGGTNKKRRGFFNLLNSLRRHPDFLPLVLNRALSNKVKIHGLGFIGLRRVMGQNMWNM